MGWDSAAAGRCPTPLSLVVVPEGPGCSSPTPPSSSARCFTSEGRSCSTSVGFQVLLHVIEQGSVTGRGSPTESTPSAVPQQLRRPEREVGQPCSPATPAAWNRPRRVRCCGPCPQGAESASPRPRLTCGDRRPAAGHLSIGTFATVAAPSCPWRCSASATPTLDPHEHPQCPRGRAADRAARAGRGGPVAALGLRLATAGPHPVRDHRPSRTPPCSSSRPTTCWPAEIGDHGRSWRARRGSSGAAASGGRGASSAAAAANFEPRISFEANDHQEAQAGSASASGVALVPRTAVMHKHPGVRVVALAPVRPHAASSWPTDTTECAHPRRSRSTKCCWTWRPPTLFQAGP